MTRKHMLWALALLLLGVGVWWVTRKGKALPKHGDVDFAAPQVNFNPNSPQTTVGMWNPLYQKQPEETELQRLTRESAEAIRAHDAALAEEDQPVKI